MPMFQRNIRFYSFIVIIFFLYFVTCFEETINKDIRHTRKEEKRKTENLIM
jgi:hypothetical protein